jgi:ligand-binding SRPBCC domain-containing protein
VRIHTLERSQTLSAPPEAAFEFFGDAHNLEAITPPWLGFRIVTPAPIEMRPGAVIEYRLKLHRVPVSWRSLPTASRTPRSRAPTASGTTRTPSSPRAVAAR